MSDTLAVWKAQLAAKRAEVDKAMQEEMEAIVEEERLQEERARLERERKAAEEKAERERKEAEAKSKGKRKAVDEGAESGAGAWKRRRGDGPCTPCTKAGAECIFQE